MRSRWLAHMSAAWLLTAIGGAAAHAQGAMDAWANFVLAPKQWKGQMVNVPDAVPRPTLPAVIDSDTLPLRVHAAGGTAPERLALVLDALEQAYLALARAGWPLPLADGGLGGSLALDLYLAPDARRAAYAELDGMIAWVDFDAAQTYAVVDAGLARDDLAACVTSALVQASLRGFDPSEADAVLRSTGDFAAWTLLGEHGCEDDMLTAQREPERGDTLSLLLALLAERHDGGSGRFVEALWELTRQRSRGLVKPGVLRSSPDLWEAMESAVESVGEAWNDDLEELVAARVFAGEPRGRVHASYRVLAAMPDGARVPMRADFEYAQLPKRLRGDAVGLPTLGSSYLRVRTLGVSDDDQLHVWLRGELGPRWSLVAIRRGADGREIGRVKAPLRRTPESYLPVQLTRDTAEVVLVVTNLPPKLPDADVLPLASRVFELTVDRVATH